MRRDGKSLGQMARDEIGKVGGVAALIAALAIMIILLAPIAVFMGFYLRYLRPGRVIETSVIGVVLLLLAIIGGGCVGRAPASHRARHWLQEHQLPFIAHDFAAAWQERPGGGRN